MNAYQYIRHPHVLRRRETGPITADTVPEAATGRTRAMTVLAVAITRSVGTMWCAVVFAGISLVSLPAAIHSGDPVIMVQWLSSVFLQLVLLAILAVGQNVQGAAADARAAQTYLDVEAILHETQQLQAHLAVQDEVLAALHKSD